MKNFSIAKFYTLRFYLLKPPYSGNPPLLKLGMMWNRPVDAISTKIIENLLQELKQHNTIILVTHVLRQAVRLADHLVFMYYGDIIEQGHPDDILKNPKTDILKKYLVEGN